QPGPVFSQVLLADEINRATPKAQSALLEAMEERQVSVDGVSHPLPEPFFVIATQNPVSQTGTFPLPESQLDRFLMRIELGYPDPRAERQMMQGSNPRLRIDQLKAVLTLEQLRQIQHRTEQIHLSEPILDYIQRLVHFSRQCGDFDLGLSPRGALALIRSARSWALMEGREYVIPEDVQQVLPCVAEHRLRGGSNHTTHRGASLTRQMLDAVDVLE
ncbi:MAG: MoxR family ATPase, partial [Motiliproteus sp.]|nr:MoxR family ATPase [Motiliproteus sp.]